MIELIAMTGLALLWVEKGTLATGVLAVLIIAAFGGSSEEY